MMRPLLLACVLLGSAGLIVGCGGSSSTSPPSSSTGNDDTTNHKNRLAAIRAMHGENEKKLNDLKARAEKAVGEEKTKLEAKWKDAAAKHAACGKKIDELETAGADGKLTDAYVAAHKDVGAALEEFRKAVE